MTEEKARQSELYLVGMVCYYGKHYSTFFFQTKIRRWMYFDDAHVKEVCVHTGRNICSDRCVKRFPLLYSHGRVVRRRMSFSAHQDTCNNVVITRCSATEVG